MSKARTKYKQLCQQERWNWQSRIQSEERTNERHEKYKRTARNERREVQWHRRPRSTFRAALYPSQARMRTNHHLHQINSKHHLPGNKCNPKERERERERENTRRQHRNNRQMTEGHNMLIQFLECSCYICLLYLRIKHCLFYLYIMCICNVYICSYF